jgi:UDP-N-acetylmuramoyl-L-alanyl-D-glutamate--2,6-diaminopimelate ligase
MPAADSTRPRHVIPWSLATLPGLISELGLAPSAGLRMPARESEFIRGITHDSRAVQPGDLYAALPGQHAHGAGFADQAAAAGAAAILTDPAGADLAAGSGLPVAVVVDARALLGSVAAAIYGRPTDQLTVLGVTGTNGKTTVAYLMEAGLRASGQTTGLIGTIETRVAGTAVASVRTTPESTDLQALFARMVEAGVTSVAMEVSSHALVQGRVAGTRFQAAAFTNLSQDHLDYHGGMEDYFAAKSSLFLPVGPGPAAQAAGLRSVPLSGTLSRRAVIDTDTDYGRRLASARPDAAVLSTNGTQVADTGRSGTSWLVRDTRLEATGSHFVLVGSGAWGSVPVHINLPGSFNVSNAALAIVTLAESGLPLAVAAEGVAGVTGVPGRMERVDAGQPYLALVDYAHTPDAVGQLLRTVRAITTGQVIVVLGCGGDRDPGKRPLMGAAAAQLADVAVLTSDNPRSEDPANILEAMRAGADSVNGGQVRLEIDRAAAIAWAVAHAQTGDTVVVAGKGHETGQEQAGVTHPFDDRDVLRAALNDQVGPAARSVRPA